MGADERARFSTEMLQQGGVTAGASVTIAWEPAYPRMGAASSSLEDAIDDAIVVAHEQAVLAARLAGISLEQVALDEEGKPPPVPDLLNTRGYRGLRAIDIAHRKVRVEPA